MLRLKSPLVAWCWQEEDKKEFEEGIHRELESLRGQLQVSPRLDLLALSGRACGINEHDESTSKND